MSPTTSIPAVIRFTNGKKINLELYPEVASLSVENFVELAKSGFYDGLCFHRVIPGFMIQGGGFIAKGEKLSQKKAPRTVKGEFRSNGVENALLHTAGTLSMARTSVKDSATSQFFICVADVPYLDGEYAAFGKVADADSFKVAVQVSEVRTATKDGYENVPVQPIEIQTIEVRV
ncbi:MAG: peptidylprolyl isomerase [Firmicutes bacterium]|nr:peptidylprolyl isomerase [Bacillota bacterium]